nr:MAG TPA: hypothetical protein [Crassvirales sp.]
MPIDVCSSCFKWQTANSEVQERYKLLDFVLLCNVHRRVRSS